MHLPVAPETTGRSPHSDKYDHGISTSSTGSQGAVMKMGFFYSLNVCSQRTDGWAQLLPPAKGVSTRWVRCTSLLGGLRSKSSEREVRNDDVSDIFGLKLCGVQTQPVFVIVVVAFGSKPIGTFMLQKSPP